MRSSALLISAITGLLLGDSTVDASFHRDVVSKTAKKDRVPLPFISGKSGSRNNNDNNVNMEDELLSKAIPLSEYHNQLRALGVDVPFAALESANGERRLEEDGDDYFMADEDMYSFSGYSMKYAKCQPIQQFSEDALLAGEYSPMVTQDVIILRLCPYKSCSSSRQYGCHYNYAEYAIGLNDYMKVMLRYRADKKERLCEWCQACNNAERKLEEDEDQDEDEEEQEDNGEDEEEQADDEAEGDDNAEAANGDDNANYYDEDDECYVYSSYCENYSYDCAADDDDAEGDDANQNQDDYYYNQNGVAYIDEDEYYNFLGCTELADQYGAMYFVRPACDTSDSTIKMEVFYDEYCSQSASKVASIDSFQVGFNDEVFESMYDGSCMDCSESNYPPTFNANSYMCNKMHDAGAGCTNNMIYDLFDGQSSSTSTECSFIESIRFGTYDSNGEITVQAAEDAEQVVTDLQKVGLIMSAFICAGFVIYACYLHHSMTNLLIKSLSHRELLPASRQKQRRTPSFSKPKRRRSKGSKGSRRSDEEDDDEWDRSKPLV